jgi:hypothetical protein
MKNQMTKEELFKLHGKTFEKCVETMRKKNEDYSGCEDPFRNFRSAEYMGIHPVQGILIRINDKLQRVNTYVTKGVLKVDDESAEDSIDDAINYLILAKGMLVEEGTVDEEGREDEEI